jgi:hypothetical protein
LRCKRERTVFHEGIGIEELRDVFACGALAGGAANPAHTSKPVRRERKRSMALSLQADEAAIVRPSRPPGWREMR